jgi:hypothetical protein
MEQEYRELTRSPALKAGERIFKSIMDANERRASRAEAKEKRALENNRLKADIIKSKEMTKQRASEAEKAASEASKARSDAEKAKTTRKRDLINSKIAYKATTIRGGIGKRINQKLTSGVSDKMKSIRAARGQAKANKILSDSAWKLQNRQEDQRLKDESRRRKENKKKK